MKFKLSVYEVYIYTCYIYTFCIYIKTPMVVLLQKMEVPIGTGVQ